MEFKVELIVTDEDGSNPRPDDVMFRVDPQLDTIRLGAAVGTFGETLKAVNAEDDPLLATKLLDTEWPKVREAFGHCLLPPSRKRWAEHNTQVDIDTLANIVRWVQLELAGTDPTEPVSSPAGSPTTSTPSTAGALPGASTSDDSRTAGP